jgi:hypothetical protein
MLAIERQAASRMIEKEKQEKLRKIVEALKFSRKLSF